MYRPPKFIWRYGFNFHLSETSNFLPVVVRSGTCPKVSEERRSVLFECPPPESQIGSCLIDTDCENEAQKCCSDGCNLVCTNTIEEKKIKKTSEKGKLKFPRKFMKFCMKLTRDGNNF